MSYQKLLLENVTQSSPLSTIDTQQAKLLCSLECKICGAPARYSYYGAVACESCKMFFKRNAENKQVMKIEIIISSFILILIFLYLGNIRM